MPIANPNPVTPGVCNQYWATLITVTPTRLRATELPSDGVYLIGNPGLQHGINVDLTQDAAGMAVMNAVFAEAQKLAGKTLAVTQLQVAAPDPSAKVTAIAVFSDKSIYVTQDLFGLMATDQQAAAAFASMEAYLAGK
jgi:hypothetical protein